MFARACRSRKSVKVIVTKHHRAPDSPANNLAAYLRALDEADEKPPFRLLVRCHLHASHYGPVNGPA